jgi:hypothetical protein
MEDWIASAISSAKNQIQKNAAVAKDALRCNRWIASSALQKAIRRGDTALAERAAFVLHREDCSATWRRLIAIAFEDVGPADLDVVLETVAVATLPKWRAVIGEEAALRSNASGGALWERDRTPTLPRFIGHSTWMPPRVACSKLEQHEDRRRVAGLVQRFVSTGTG